jgi:hypothetical protein
MRKQTNDKSVTSFADFTNNKLSESTNSTLVFGYGRFQPPTIGHALLVHSVEGVARQHRATGAVFVSNSHDRAKNPLTAEQRVHFLSKMFPKSVKFAAAPEVIDHSTGKKTVGILGILKAHDGKYKNIVIVAGSDRVPEFQRQTAKYNGNLYNYDSITVVSAGERDPDAEGVGGMSGTKMRAAAANMEWVAFRSGIPPALSDQDTKDLMYTLHKAMKPAGVTTESKAIFLIGGTGSGKDLILRSCLSNLGLTEVSAHALFKDADHPLIESKSGMIINGMGDNFESYQQLKLWLESKGYSTMALMVHVSDEVSRKRNAERDRSLSESVRFQKWNSTYGNTDKFRKLFGESYIEFDNSIDLTKAPPGIKANKMARLSALSESAKKFVMVERKVKTSPDLNAVFESKFKAPKGEPIKYTKSTYTKFVGSGPKSIPVTMKIKKRLDEKHGKAS